MWKEIENFLKGLIEEYNDNLIDSKITNISLFDGAKENVHKSSILYWMKNE